jgi:hypothetical protein
MARYYFHIDGHRPHRDEVGEECADDSVAWQSAIRLTRDIEDGFQPGHSWQLEVHHDKLPVYIVAITTRKCR